MNFFTQQFSSFWIRLSFHTIRISCHHFRVSFRDTTLFTSLAPYILHYLKHFFIYWPRVLRKFVQNVKSSMIIGISKNSLLDWAMTVFHNCSCLWVIPSYLRVLPRKWFNYCWEWSFHMNKNIFCFLEFWDDFLEKVFVNS